jgi:hypothetical protein
MKERLKLVKVAGDGQCLFNSISYLVLLHEKKVLNKENVSKYSDILREAVCNNFKTEIDEERKVANIKPNLVTQQLSLGLDDFNIKNNSQNGYKKAMLYIAHMRKKGSWAGEMELRSLSKIINSLDYKGIIVYILVKDKGNPKTSEKGVTRIGKLFVIQNFNEFKNNKSKPFLEILMHTNEKSKTLSGEHYDPLVNVREAKHANVH